MERKLIRQGGGGCTVYLPKRWVERKGLDAGGTVTIEETETSLVITAPRSMRRDTILTLTDENRGDLQNLLTHLYRRGADSIVLKGVDPHTIVHASRIATDLLLGFEVTERTGTTVRLENLSEPAEAKYDQLLRRVFHIITETHGSIRTQALSGKYDVAAIEDARKNVDKYVLFCRRTLIKELERRNVSTAWELLTFLMHIQHAYDYLAQRAAHAALRVAKSDIVFYDELASRFALFTRAHVERDITAIHAINRTRGEQYRQLNDRIARSHGAQSVFLCDVRDISRLMQIGTSPILSEILEKEFDG